MILATGPQVDQLLLDPPNPLVAENFVTIRRERILFATIRCLRCQVHYTVTEKDGIMNPNSVHSLEIHLLHCGKEAR